MGKHTIKKMGQIEITAGENTVLRLARVLNERLVVEEKQAATQTESAEIDFQKKALDFQEYCIVERCLSPKDAAVIFDFIQRTRFWFGLAADFGAREIECFTLDYKNCIELVLHYTASKNTQGYGGLSVIDFHDYFEGLVWDRQQEIKAYRKLKADKAAAVLAAAAAAEAERRKEYAAEKRAARARELADAADKIRTLRIIAKERKTRPFYAKERICELHIMPIHRLYLRRNGWRGWGSRLVNNTGQSWVFFHTQK